MSTLFLPSNRRQTRRVVPMDHPPTSDTITEEPAFYDNGNVLEISYEPTNLIGQVKQIEPRAGLRSPSEDGRSGAGKFSIQARKTEHMTQTTPGIAASPIAQDPVLQDLKNNSKLPNYAPVWDRYVKLTKEEDEDLVEDWDRIIDVTLVFAALFSAILTAFVLESAKGLQVDQTRATVAAIMNLTGTIQTTLNVLSGIQSTETRVTQIQDTFRPTSASVWVNCLWFLSLGLSISVSLFAMLAKRWCYNFRSRRFGTAFERSMKRQRSWNEIEKWKIELIMEQLPTVMHVALMLFFIGLVIYLSEIHTTTTIVVTVLVGVTLTAYWSLTIIAVFSHNCPLLTPFTKVILACFSAAKAFKVSRMIKLCIQYVLGIISQLDSWKTPGVAETSQSILMPPRERFRMYFRRLLFRWQRINARGATSHIQASLRGIIHRSMARGASFWHFIMGGRRSEGNRTNSDPTSNWILRGYRGTSGSTILRPTRTDTRDPNLFRALFWIIRHSNDKEALTEVIEYLAYFPELLLESSVSGEKLYDATLKVFQCLTQSQNDTSDWQDTDRFSLLCGQLAYLASRPWLHSPTSAKSLGSLNDISYQYFTAMTTDDFHKQLKLIKSGTLFRSSKGPTLWLESFAVKLVVSCSPEQALHICMALLEEILSSRAIWNNEDQKTEVCLTLWWIYLNCAFDSSGYAWPGDPLLSDLPNLPGHTAVNTDSLLTLMHLRDSRNRVAGAAWLTITGLSGILYAFSRIPSHERGPLNEANHVQFETIISILLSTLCAPKLAHEDQFMGTIPVYNDTEVRLYHFSSLEYCIDAVTAATGSSCFLAFSDRLNDLMNRAQALNSITKAYGALEESSSDISLLVQQYKNRLYEDRHPEFWMAAGIFGQLSIGDTMLEIPGGLRHIARVIADLNFGFSPDSARVTATMSRLGEASKEIYQHSIPWEIITWWTWGPFNNIASFFAVAEEAIKSNEGLQNLRPGALWKVVHHVGFPDVGYYPDLYAGINSHASLFVKAALLERLYSFSVTGPSSPDRLRWSLAVSKQFYRLLRYWWVEIGIPKSEKPVFSVEDQAFIVTPLAKLLEVLVDACSQTQPNSEQNLEKHQVAVSGPDNAPDVSVDAYTQLGSLIEAGSLEQLGLPFTAEFEKHELNSPDIPDEHEWRHMLVRVIDRAGRAHPRLSASRGRIPYTVLTDYYQRLPDGEGRTEMLRVIGALEDHLMAIKDAPPKRDSASVSNPTNLNGDHGNI